MVKISFPTINIADLEIRTFFYFVSHSLSCLLFPWEQVSANYQGFDSENNN